MTVKISINGAAFVVFMEPFLCNQVSTVWVVVMENLPAHKLASIVPMIESLGASVICLPHTLAYFNPLEQGLSQLK